MKQQLQQRLQVLKAEFEAGQKVMAELEAKQAHIRDTMLRIQGAIQVLEEELAQVEEPIPSTASTDHAPSEPLEVTVNSHG
jgi:predicted nuclease with TOPRIM domain